MKILFFTKYGTSGASSRYRTFQYLPFLRKHGIDLDINELFSNSDLARLYIKGTYGFLRLVKSFIRRLFVFPLLKKYDLIIIEYELFPYLPSFFEYLLKLCKKKYILDYDDAIFHNYDMNPNLIIRLLLRNKIRNVIKNSAAVITGNTYLFEYASRCNNNVKLIPTVINYNNYLNITLNEQKNDFIIGWVGSPTSSKYLIPLIDVFLRLDPKLFKLKFIGVDENVKPLFKDLPVEWVKWSKDSEIEEIKTFSVGIMPLEDSPWTRGKCGFKLIQYMACGIPVIASPVGANKEIVIHGVNGFLAESKEEWHAYFLKLFNEKELREKLGKKGLNLVKNKYSLKKTSIEYRELIFSFS